MTWRVTHVDFVRHRHQVLLECESSRAAQAIAEAMYGAAFYLAIVRLRAAGAAS